MLKIYNTLTKQKDVFEPINPGQVGVYTCGPTVYDYDHLGHAWNYFNADVLRRAFEYFGYKVNHVMNITDVGHLVSDGDEGEDKMEKKAKAEGKSAYEIAEFFTKIFLENRQKMNFLEPTTICKATDHIKEMIALVQTLLDKGYAYKIEDGVYFDTSKFSNYGQLSGNVLDKIKEGARIEVNLEKRNPSDFALWKFVKGDEQRQMVWEAFGHKSFPGWHIECSAMSMKYLGPHFDVHSGGEDNIFPHHECEIAQSEGANGVKFVNYWVHTRFLKVEGEKMSKSKKNFFRISDIEERGMEAMDLRYLFLTSHHTSQFNFTWDALKAARVARLKLVEFLSGVDKIGQVNEDFKKRFGEFIEDDLSMSQVMALVWELVKSSLSDEDKKATLLDFDQILGLRLGEAKKATAPADIVLLAQARLEAKQAKDWAKADALRDEIKVKGWMMEDSKDGSYNLRQL